MNPKFQTYLKFSVGTCETRKTYEPVLCAECSWEIFSISKLLLESLYYYKGYPPEGGLSFTLCSSLHKTDWEAKPDQSVLI